MTFAGGFNPFEYMNSDFNPSIPTIGGMSADDITLPPELQAAWDSIGQTMNGLKKKTEDTANALNPSNAIDNVKTGFQTDLTKWTIYGVLLLIIIVAILGLVLPHTND